ncbi:probable methyltransferase TARBP1 [Diachasmimorpha longicaudata]|uniref:probable methyltransferase TARBP1 n=1 Tax=Diachasmimorpha longicaudata TaxID=58733 RepID=UPI0030B8C6C4
MGRFEALHEAFTNTSTAGFTLLSILDPSFEDDPSKFIHKVMNVYHQRVRENTTDEKLHNAFRDLLCYQYQLHNESKMKTIGDYSNEKLLDNLRRILFYSGDNNETIKTILNDVAILQIICYANNESIQQLFSEALEFIQKQLDEGNTLHNNLPVLEIISDAVALQTRLFTEAGEFISVALPATVKAWFPLIDENNSQEWRPFVSLLLKLTKTINPPGAFINMLWEYIQGYNQHTSKKSLTLLCGLIDDFFSNHSRDILELNLKSTLSDSVLALISNHLTSNIQLHRKQAQYSLKKIVNYLRRYPQELMEWTKQRGKSRTNRESEEHLMYPFVLCEDDSVSIEEIESNFFSLLESLEEKQAHLVLPALAHLDKFLVASVTYESLFNRTWLKCIFTRVLNHANNNVITAGLSTLLQVNLYIFDDEFMLLLMETLNKTFLYEYQNPDLQPRVLQDLSDFFIKAESSEINLTSKFIIQASKINWSPIPLLYILEALGNNAGMTDVEHNLWGREELEALRLISEIHVKQLIQIMKIPAQRNILNCITIYVKSPFDFFAICRILPSIINEGALKRGDDKWKLLTNLLKMNIEESAAVKSISKCCEHFLKCETDDAEVKALAIMVVLICDAENKLLTESVTSICLYQLFLPIVDAYKRVYANPWLYLKALQVITYLMELSPKKDDPYVTLIFGFSQSILDLIMNSLRSNWPRSYKTGKIYMKVLSAILRIEDPSFTEFINSMINIADEEIEKILDLINLRDTPVIRTWYTLNILHLLKKSKNCGTIVSNRHPTFVSSNGDGKIVSECYGLVAKIYLDFVESNEKLSSEFFKEFLNEKLMPLAETKSDDALPNILKILRFIIVKQNDCGEIMNASLIIRDIIEVCWSTLRDMHKTEMYRISAEVFLELLLTRHFLRIEEFRHIALNYVHEIISQTDNSSSLRCLLFKRMICIDNDDVYIFRDAILSSFLQTDVGKINKRIDMQTCCYIIKNVKINFITTFGLGAYTDVITRAFLAILITRVVIQCKENISESYIPQLLRLLEKQSNKRYFGDSNAHRRKLRIMQVLLLMTSEISEDNALKIHNVLTQLTLIESDQSSVRIMKEWILIRLHTRYETLRNSVWDLFISARENRPGGLPSLISIVYHVSKSLRSLEQVEYIRKAVTYILPSCFCQQFVVRLYSQVILCKLWEMTDEIAPEVSMEYESVRAAIHESLVYGNMMTNSMKLFDNFYFSKFNSEHHWNLYSIFYDIPRLTNVSMDEWIRFDEDGLFQHSFFNKVNSLPYFRYDNELSKIPSSSSLKNSLTPDADVFNEDSIADIQKKIIPSTFGISTSDSLVTMKLKKKLITNDTGLIVIATLIEGFPNLGGLARTAEIFCARELILKSKRYTENKDFQSLSVTAEKWITISEVKPHELRDYLLEQKSKGWNLIGAEQTANSVNLLDIKFKEKTILLLGNEKTGIPANLIQLLDTCVEIPQAGVIRSLNVHVTGAICMWQYAQQHLFQCS